MTIVNIKEPYYTAGRKFKWEGKPIGIGLDVDYIASTEVLRVTVGNDKQVWTIPRQTAIDFIKKHSSFYNARGTKLGVLPWHIFTKE